MRRSALPWLSLIVFTGVVSLGAGDLDPPGAPAPSMVDLTTINDNAAAARSNASSAANEARAAQEPRTPITAIPVTIEEPGSYVVTQNLTHSAGDGSPGIVIATSNVTLDLGGFHLTRSASASSGIVAIGDPENIAVLNGTLSEWDRHGIDLSAADGVRVEGVQVFRCDEDGIVVGSAAVVTECTSVGNFGSGFVTGSACTLRDCAARSSFLFGFDVGPGSSLEGCVARFQLDDNFRLDSGCTVEACTSSDGFGDGFQGEDGCIFRGCTAENSAGVGFIVGDNASLSDSTARDNGDDGFDTGLNATVRNCSAQRNGQPESANGFWLGSGSAIIECAAEGNSGSGIGAGSAVNIQACVVRGNDGNGIVTIGGVIIDCSAETNGANGIDGGDGSTLCRNNCYDNGSAGIVAGFNCRVDSNDFENNNVSIRIKDSGNWVVRNHLGGEIPPIEDNGSNNRIGSFATDPDNAGPWDNLN